MWWWCNINQKWNWLLMVLPGQDRSTDYPEVQWLHCCSWMVRRQAPPLPTGLWVHHSKSGSNLFLHYHMKTVSSISLVLWSHPLHYVLQYIRSNNLTYNVTILRCHKPTTTAADQEKQKKSSFSQEINNASDATARWRSP